jgi:hypothetical protein
MNDFLPIFGTTLILNLPMAVALVLWRVYAN